MTPRHVSREDARNLIVELALPRVVLDLYDGRELPLVQYRCPESYFGMSAAEQALYASDRVVPFLDGGSSDILYGYDFQDRAFLRFFLEAPRQAPRWSWQQLLGRELQVLWEAELTDDELREVATSFGFRHLDLMLQRLAGADLSTFEKHREWLAAFLSEIAHRETRSS